MFKPSSSLIHPRLPATLILPGAALFLLSGCLPGGEGPVGADVAAARVQAAGTINVTWSLISYGGKEIGIGGPTGNAESSVWITGSWQNYLYNWGGSGWISSSAQGMEIDIDTWRRPFVVGADGKVYGGNSAGTVWGSYPTDLTFSDIGVGSGGHHMWALGATKLPGSNDYPIYRASSHATDWTLWGGGAVRIDVAPDHMPWIVNSSGIVFEGKPNFSLWDWIPKTGVNASDIGIGADGTVWILGGTTYANGDRQVYRWSRTGNKWEPGNGGGKRISVDKDGKPWIVNSNGHIYRCTAFTGHTP